MCLKNHADNLIWVESRRTTLSERSILLFEDDPHTPSAKCAEKGEGSHRRHG